MQPPISNNTLVALIPSKEDFEIARSQNWYRIPRGIKRVPRVLTEGRLQFLAFYHPKVFGPWAYSIRYVAAVKSISIAKRKDLIPLPANAAAQEMWQKKAEEEYYKIDLGPLQELPNPVFSRTWRRLVFLETTDRKLHDTTEVNELFRGSALEEHFYTALKGANVLAEREYYVKVGPRHCFLDFAIFCKAGKINIECDGVHHNHLPEVDLDRGRNNLLQSAGWSVLRFTENDVYNHTAESLSLVAETITRYGGLR